jgi:hypothetical protein
MPMTKIPLPPLLAAAIAIPMVATVAFAGLLAKRAAERPPALVVPGVREPRGIVADDVPPEMARDFALAYLAQFDNYTPATIEAATAFLKTRIAPDFFTQAEEALDRRKKMVQESRMSSSLAVEKPHEAAVAEKDGTLEVTLRGVRRIFVADKLREERTLLYRLRIERATPTKLNPYGLAIVGQSVTTESTREMEK